MASHAKIVAPVSHAATGSASEGHRGKPAVEKGRRAHAAPGPDTGEGSGAPVGAPPRPKTARVGEDFNPNPQDTTPKPDRSRGSRQPRQSAGPSHVARVGNGVMKMGGSIGSPKSGDGSGAVVAIFAVIGLVVGMAILRGTTTINKGAALLAWLLLFFICTVIAKLNRALGIAFASLLLIEAVLEFGPQAFGGFLGSPGATTAAGTTASTAIQPGGVNLAGDATAAILGYLGVKAGTDFLGGVASGAGKVAGTAAAGAAGAAGGGVLGWLKSKFGSAASDVGGAAETVGEGAAVVGEGAAEAVTGGAE